VDSNSKLIKNLYIEVDEIHEKIGALQKMGEEQNSKID